MRLSSASTLVSACTLQLCVACSGEDSKASEMPGGDSGIELPEQPFGALRDAGPIGDGGSIPREQDVDVELGGEEDPRFENVPKPPACSEAPKAEQLYKHTMPIYGFGLVADTLYFAGYEEGVYAMPKDGSEMPRVVSTAFGRDLAVAGDSIYVSGAFGGVRLTPAQLAAAEEAEELSMDATLQSFGGLVYSWPDLPVCFTGTNTARVFTSEGEQGVLSFPCGVMAVTGVGDDVFAVVSKSDESAGLYKATLGSDDEPVQILREHGLARVGANASHVYFTKGAGADDDYLMRAPLAGGTSEVIAGPLSVNSFASDGTDMFISDAKSGCVYRFDTGNDALVPVARAGLAEDIAFDDHYLYFGTFSGAISRVPR